MLKVRQLMKIAEIGVAKRTALMCVISVIKTHSPLYCFMTYELIKNNIVVFTRVDLSYAVTEPSLFNHPLTNE